MSIISDITRAWTWLTKNFQSHAVDADKVAVTITEAAKTILANPVTGFIINMADAVTATQVPSNITNAINGVIPKILAVELGIQGLPANATEEQILAFEQAILNAFDIKSNNSKLYTEIAAQVYGIIQTNIANGTTNFAGWVGAVGQAYASYQKDLSANAMPPIVAPVLVDNSVTQLADETPTV